MILVLLFIGSVVRIETGSQWGHGIVVEKNVVLTALHLVEGATTIRIHGRVAKIKRIEAHRDLAWLGVKTDGWVIESMGRYKPKKPIHFDGKSKSAVMAIVVWQGRYVVFGRFDGSLALGDSGLPVRQGGAVVGVIVARKGNKGYFSAIK